MIKPIEGEIVPPDVETPVDHQKAANDERKVREGFWRTFQKALRYIPFSKELVASYYCALDPKTPMAVRATLLGALAYFVLPLDTIPDFIFGFGFTDDITVLTAVIASIRAHITDEHRALAHEALSDDSTDTKEDK